MSKTYGYGMTVWNNGKENTVTVYVGMTNCHTTITLTRERARHLIQELEKELERLPATVTAADLGIEGAPV